VRKYYSCSTRVIRPAAGPSEGCLRRRAWILGFSSADTTNSSARKAAPSQLRAYRSSTRPALSGEERVSRKDPAAMAPGLEGIRTEPAPECHPADLRDDTAGDDLTLEFVNREARQRYSESRRDLAGEALNLDDDAGEKRAGRPPRGCSSSPARRSRKNLWRHLLTIWRGVSSRAAIASFPMCCAASKMILARMISLYGDVYR